MEKFTITVTPAVIDGEDYFEGRVKEFPDVATYGETPWEAKDLALDAAEALTALREEMFK